MLCICYWFVTHFVAEPRIHPLPRLAMSRFTAVNPAAGLFPGLNFWRLQFWRFRFGWQISKNTTTFSRKRRFWSQNASRGGNRSTEIIFLGYLLTSLNLTLHYITLPYPTLPYLALPYLKLTITLS